MNETQINFQLLAVFAAVAEHRSFSRAARQLGVGKGTVSRSIARLEAQLEVELLHRTTHRVALSTAGLALYERAGPHVAGLRTAVLDLPELGEEPSGLLRITAPPDLGTELLPPLLTAFARRHPNIRFDVRLTGERVDLVQEGFDLAIRISPDPVGGAALESRPLGEATLAYFASPSYLARRGRPRVFAGPRHLWVMHATAIRALSPTPESVQVVADDFFFIRELLVQGLGVGVLPGFVAARGIRDGLLEEIALNDRIPRAATCHVVLPINAQRSRKVRAFSDFLVEAFSSGLR